MSNINGNVFPAWGINAQNQVFAVDTSNKIHLKSGTDFAEVIGISENGILWAISTIPDPKSGSIIFWSTGDGLWIPAGNNIPGAVLLTGAGPDTAFYYTEDGSLWSINIQGSGYLVAKIQDIQQLDYGGSNLWAVFPVQTGGIPCLQFWNIPQSPMKWQPFNGAPQPMGISASYNGDCYGALSYSPVFFGKDGTSTGSAGSGDSALKANDNYITLLKHLYPVCHFLQACRILQREKDE